MLKGLALLSSLGSVGGVVLQAQDANVLKAQDNEPGNKKMKDPRPNILVFIGDDIGYSDLSCYHSPNISTPNLDAIAASGTRMTQWIVAMPLCTPSRASIQTGRLAPRTSCVGLSNSNRVIPSQAHPGGLDPVTEKSIARMLKEAGYATGMSGKWHLGMNKNTEAGSTPDYGYTPWAHGYDSSLFAPMGNIGSCAMNDEGFSAAAPAGPGNCHFVANKTVVQYPYNLRFSTEALVGHALDFIERQEKGKPWFFLMAFLQAHTPMFNHPDNHGRSHGGEYGDNVEELDLGVGDIMSAVKKHGFYANTLVFFTSDNGPHAEEHWSEAGRNNWRESGPMIKLRGAKGQTYEGGIRVPGLVSWPKHLPAGQVTNTFMTSLDIFATAADVAGVVPRNIDGKSIIPVIKNNAATQHPVHIHHCGFRPLAARIGGRFKLHWAEQKWYTFNAPAFEECIECCNGLNEMAWKYYGLKIGNICGCQDADVVQHDTPVIYDLLYDIGERTPLTEATWPHETGLTMQEVIDQANAEKERIAQSGLPVPDGDGAGFCNGGSSDPMRQACCKGCHGKNDRGTMMCVDEKDEPCTCDIPMLAPTAPSPPWGAVSTGASE